MAGTSQLDSLICGMPYKLSLATEPFVVVELKGQMSDDELLTMTNDVTSKMREHQRDGKRVAVVIDLSAGERIPPRQRKMMADWRRDISDLTKQVALGMAMVAESATVRGVMTAIGWVSPEPVEVVYVRTRREAFEQALAWCDAAGVWVPDSLRQTAGSARSASSRP